MKSGQPNHAINADSQEQCSFVALLLAAGYGGRWGGSMSAEDWFEFEIEAPLPEGVEEFLVALRQEAAMWPNADPLDSQVYESHDGYLTYGLYVSDGKSIYRCLRVDFDSKGLECGEDETGQFGTRLSSDSAEYFSLFDTDLSPTQMAHAAARWFRQQMVRPIEFLEWQDGDYHLRRWRLADSKRWLSWSASDNKVRVGLGNPVKISLVEIGRGTGAQQTVPADRGDERRSG